MGNIWQEHLEKMRNGSDNQIERFRKLSKVTSDMMITEKNQAKLLGLIAVVIQLETSIAILSKLDAMEAERG